MGQTKSDQRKYGGQQWWKEGEGTRERICLNDPRTWTTVWGLTVGVEVGMSRGRQRGKTETTVIE